jgi:putative transcriptional regulator
MSRKPKDTEEQVISRVEDYRTAAGLSRQQLADLVGVHYQTIGYIERGEYNPSLVLALRIARALHVGIELLFRLPDDPDHPPARDQAAAAE